VQDLIHIAWGWPALVGGVVLLPDARRRRIAAAGLGALALALAGLRVGGGQAQLPADFAGVELALVLIGLAVLVSAAFSTARSRGRWALALVLLAAGVVLLLGNIVTLARAARMGGTIAALGVMGGVGALVWVGAGKLLPRAAPSAAEQGRPIAPRWIACAAGGVLLAALAPHVLLIFAGVVLAAIAVGAEGLRRPRFSSAVAPAVAVGTLAAAGWLLVAIAGDQGLATVTLPELPLSPAAETLLAPLLLLAGWSVAGLWPMPRSPLTGLAGLAGLFLLGRLVVPTLPQGLEHWRPLAYPVLGLALWQAVASRRWAAALIGGALFALIAGTRDGVAAVWWLGAGALAEAVAGYLARGDAPWLVCLAALAAGIGTVPGTAAGLGAEVVYTTVTVAGLAVLLAAGGSPVREDP
jgi:hypothetical protein